MFKIQCNLLGLFCNVFLSLFLFPFLPHLPSVKIQCQFTGQIPLMISTEALNSSNLGSFASPQAAWWVPTSGGSSYWCWTQCRHLTGISPTITQKFESSSDPSASASLVAGITSMSHHIQLFFFQNLSIFPYN